MMMKIIPGVLLFYIIICFRTNSLNAESDDCSVCGKGPASFPPNSLIGGGKEVPNTKSFPWLVKIEYMNEVIHCAGSILDGYFILTAAHCIKHIYEGELSALDKLSIFLQTESEKRFEKAGDIETMEVHPKYRLIKSNTSGILFAKYDIGLIKLKEKIKCNQYRRSICLPKADYKVPTNKELHIAGWGLQDPAFHLKSKQWIVKLHYGILKRVHFKRCAKVTPEIKRVKDHMLCLGNTEQTVCPGDSGGPLIDKINGKYTVLGVTSSSETTHGCRAADPVLYTNVAVFVNWIKETKRKLLKKSYHLIENVEGKCARERCKERNKNKRCP